MTATIKNLLVIEPTEDGTPLFANSVKLAEAIAESSPNAYKNPKTTAALLNFVFRCERTCSASLREAILHAVRARLAKLPRPIQDDWIQRVDRAADKLSFEVAEAQMSCVESDDDQFNRLLKRAEVAKWHFIIAPLTAEQEGGIESAEELNRKLLKHLGIHPRNEANPKTEYWFLLPKMSTGEKFWNKLREKAILITEDSQWVDIRLKALDDGGYLRVYVVPSFVCGCPIVVYDPDQTRGSAGFSFSYHKGNVIDAIQWDDFSIAHWRENVFEAFKWKKPGTEDEFNESEAFEFMKNHSDYFAGYRCHCPFDLNNKQHEHTN